VTSSEIAESVTCPKSVGNPLLTMTDWSKCKRKFRTSRAWISLYCNRL